MIITACKDEQKSYFDPLQPLTVFADILIRVLQGEDILTNKNVITVFQLYDTLYEKVQETVQRIWKLEQQPELTVSKGVGSIPVAFYHPKRRSALLGVEDDATQPQPREITQPEQLQHQQAIRIVDPTESAQALKRLTAPKRTRKGGM